MKSIKTHILSRYKVFPGGKHEGNVPSHIISLMLALLVEKMKQLLGFENDEFGASFK